MSIRPRAIALAAVAALALSAACTPTSTSTGATATATAPTSVATSAASTPSSTAATTAPAPATTTPPVPVPAGDRGPGCQTDDHDQSKPTATPPGTEFKPLGSLLVPTSRTTGPLLYEGGFWHCFAHTPEGAARAAAVLAAIDTGHDDWEKAARTQIYPPSAAKEYADHRLNDPLHAEGVGSVKVVAFSVMTYTPERAMVMLLVDLPGARPGIHNSTTANLRWADGDWRLDMSAEGHLPKLGPGVGGTYGFVTW
ncbi:hypothetical protein KV557_21370 [Kitasatospora aureofaciens]|uniref:hypothetical protein n=1 Tax=Kitasatospora aureofaciens TaxID=1894 RepID=UPI001C43DC60|nr:hypothetical protein [Kitasatospora aureofaciens]MBV6699615.1 hypothetical protein [Kitasatospora aureofaciens]